MEWDEMTPNQKRDIISQKMARKQEIGLDVIRVHREMSRIKRIYHGKMEDLNAVLEGLDREDSELKVWLFNHPLPQMDKYDLWNPDKQDRLLYDALQTINQLRAEFMPNADNSEVKDAIQDYLQKKKKYITGKGNKLDSVFYPDAAEEI